MPRCPVETGATPDYSSRGELKKVELPDGKVVEYRHDPLGRRVAKIVDGEVTEKYLWSGRTTLLAIYKGDNTLRSRFLYADARVPLGMVQDGETFYFVYDQVGSLRGVTDAAGAVVKTVRYDSFGNVIEDSNPDLDVLFGFAGGLYDRDTGLVRFGYRDYDPDTGRWTAKDPIGFGGGSSSVYEYVWGDPIGLIDPVGDRPMTVGEIKMAKRIFGSSIDYSKVDVRHDCPNDGMAYVTGNNIHFSREDFRDDFSACSPVIQALFIHEMTHVWQHQNTDYLWWWDGAIREQSLKDNPYKYHDLDHDLLEYGWEQQAAIVQDYYHKLSGIDAIHKIPGVTLNDYKRIVDQLQKNN